MLVQLDAVRIEAGVNRAAEWFLRHWVWVASGWAALVVLGAVIAPLLAAGDFDTITWLLYKAYRLLCPQRPDHSWFIAGHKMGFEQRDTAMFLAGAVGGPLYLLLRRFRWQVSWRVLLLALVPMLIDVGTQMVGLRDSDGFWRAWTGALAVLAFIAWMYPKIDSDFSEALRRMRAFREADASSGHPAQP